MLDTCFLKPRGCSWCVQQTLFRKWCLFYLRFPSSSNHWIFAKRHHHHTPGCLNDELQTELQLRARVTITISQQIIFNTRSGTYHAANSTNIRHNEDMRPLCFGPSCCMVRVRGRKSSIMSSPSCTWSIRSDPTSWISKQWSSCNMYLNWIHDHLIISYMDP